MWKHLSIFLAPIVAFSFIFNVSANSQLTTSSNDSQGLVLEWEDSEEAEMYRIDYWQESWVYSETVDFLAETTHTFTDLEPDTTYYFSLVWYDDWGNEAFKSDELNVTTLQGDTSTWSTTSENSGSQDDSWEFFVEDSKMVGPEKIQLTFSNPLKEESNDDRRFRVEWVENSGDFFEVIDSEIYESDPNSLILTLDWSPSEGVEYKVIVLSTKDVNDQNIEFWVDSETVFEWELIEEDQLDISVEDEVDVELDSAWEEEENLFDENSNNAGSDLDSEEVDSNLLNVAESNEDLPQTWPAQFVLVFLAFLFWSIIFFHKFRKS